MSTFHDFVATALARGDRFYLFSQAEQRLFLINDFLLCEDAPAAPESTPSPPPPEPAPEEELTRREEQILKMVEEGHCYRSVSEMLHVSLGTVKRTAHNIYHKIGVRSRWDLLHRRK